MTRWLRRAAVVGILLGAATLVSAALGARLSVTPGVIEVHLSQNGPGSGSGMLMNTGDTAASVMSITPDASCTSFGVTGFAIPSAPFTLGAMLSHGVGIACSASPTYGIRRCQQHVTGTSGQTLTSYTGLCMTEGSSMFMAPSSTITFPSTQVGATSAPQQVTITNPAGNPQSSILSVQLGDQDGNFKIGAPCLADGPGCDAPKIIPPSSSFQITVTCSPQSVGTHTVPLYAVGDAGTKLMPPILLTCTGTSTGSAPALSVNPTTVMLAHAVGMGSTSTMVHVANIGASDLHITSITPSGSSDWSWLAGGACSTLPCTLAPADSFDLTTTFTPSQIGARDTTLTITSDDPTEPMFSVNLDGTGQGATLALSSNLGTPPMLDLGTSPIGIQTTATFDLRNDGNITLDPVMFSLTQPGSDFSVSPNPTTIGASGIRAVTVACTPGAAGVIDGTIHVTAPTALGGSPIDIDVRCTGTTGNLFATPSSLQLGEIRTGSPRVTRTIALKTAGPQLTITGDPQLMPAVDGMALGALSSHMITTSAPATFDLTVDATADADLGTAISVTAGATLAIPVTGKIVTAKIDYPQSIVVGSFCVGQPTTAATAHMSATGSATIGLGAQPVMNKMSASPFQLSYTVPVSYPYQLPAGQSATVDITPLRQMLAGMQTDELVWTTDVAGDMAPRTMVTAQFVADGGAIAPQLADFRAVMLHQAGEPKLIKIQNCGMDPMTLLGPSIDPSGEFRDDSPAPLPATLAPNQVAMITVGFVPTKRGTRMATLTVDSSKGMLSVNLLGQGVADPDTTTDPKSFYGCSGCSTRDPAGGIALVLAMIFLVRRRRR